MRQLQAPAVLLLGGAFLAACAAGDARFTADEPAGFWFGLWHGMIAIVTLVLGVFYDHIEVYERANTGGWYDVGFLLGVLCCSGSAHQSHCARRRGRAKPTEAPPSGRLQVDVTWTADEAAAKERSNPPAAMAASPGDDPDERTG
jgi:hypothetical protein